MQPTGSSGRMVDSTPRSLSRFTQAPSSRSWLLASGFYTAAPGCLPAVALVVAQAQDTLSFSGCTFPTQEKKKLAKCLRWKKGEGREGGERIEKGGGKTREEEKGGEKKV